MKKQICLLTVSVSLIFCACNDTVTPEETAFNQVEDGHLTTVVCDEAVLNCDGSTFVGEGTETVTSDKLCSSDYILDVEYTPIYDNVKLLSSSATGNPTSYEELQDYIECYDEVSFVEYEILSVYSPQEAVEITGEDFFLTSTTLYLANIYYDLMNDESVDMTINIAKAGISGSQIESDPVYLVGQKLAAPVFNIGSSWCIALPEMTYSIYTINDIEFAYHISHENIRLTDDSLANLDMNLQTSEEFVVTSTVNNPVNYTQKSTIADLSEFIREDWSKRGYRLLNFDAVVDFDIQSGEAAVIDNAVLE